MDIPYDEKEEGLATRTSIRDDEENTREKKHTVEVSIYAGFWMRFWAYTIDVIIAFALGAFFISPIFLFLDTSLELFGVIALEGILTAAVAYVYFAVMTKLTGQTLGKMILGLRVQRADGDPLTWGDAFFREVAGRMIHRVLVFTNIMYIVVGLHPQKAGVHDLLADTRVVLDRRGTNITDEE